MKNYMRKTISLFAWLLLAGCSAHMHGCGYDFDYGYNDEASQPGAEQTPPADPATS